MLADELRGRLIGLIAIGATAVSLAALIGLHVVSPEFAPSWRMVSEYANGRHAWLLSVVFFAWAASSFALLPALWPDSAYVWFFGVALFGALFVWLMIFVTHIAFRAPNVPLTSCAGAALVGAMELALKSGDLAAAQIVAAECVVDAETKDHQNWELIGQVGKNMKGAEGAALTEAYEEVEDEEDEHLYHTTGWCRELWIESLGMPAQLPPPEEEKDVKTAIGAARAKQDRTPGRKK